jgi:two-component system NarL family sensor kinase
MNIHRHADSPTAAIRLRVDGRRLILEVEDRGRGMPALLMQHSPPGGVGTGVGIAAMHERLQKLGGTLDIESSERGTLVRAVVPLLDRQAR